jgi:two-component system chemotaxis sensor kinase CheA
MTTKEEEFNKRLLATFKTEAEEHLKNFTTDLLELEKLPAPDRRLQIIETIYREAHSLKGAARAVNLTAPEKICQTIESVLAALKNQQIELSTNLCDTLHQAIDVLNKIIFGPAAESQSVIAAQVPQIITQLLKAKRKAVYPPVKERVVGAQFTTKPKRPKSILPPQPSKSFQPEVQSSETIRIAKSKIDLLLNQVEEMLILKLTAAQNVSKISDILSSFETWHKQLSRISAPIRDFSAMHDQNTTGMLDDKLKDQIGKICEFYEWAKTNLRALENKLLNLEHSALQDNYNISSRVDSLLDEVKKIVRVPLATLSDLFPKLVRDLAHDQGKQAQLEIKGQDIEVDRRILEEIRPALIHLIRNCIDHGIEKPAERIAKNKPAQGLITIKIESLENDKFEFTISDDGSGVNLEELKSALLKHIGISAEDIEALSEQELISYIFYSGVTTSSIITDISGRGLGLAIVQEKVQHLGGKITVDTQRNKGTTFKIILPLTLVTYRGLLVRIGEQLLVVPTANIARVVRLHKTAIKTVENRKTIRFNDKIIPLIQLNAILGLPNSKPKSEILQALVLGDENINFAFQVDDIINEQEILVKPFSGNLMRVRNIAGATVLGSGQVVPILNVTDLLKAVIQISAAPAQKITAAEKPEALTHDILVVEDSITSRMLLKNILENSGYNVKTAVDGIDAFTQLREEHFDLVVSDIDMPRMNGLVLTSKIREDKKLAELPVILVTALESREDRERGIEVGANAYIVKSSFDQSNLLEVIGRLI